VNSYTHAFYTNTDIKIRLDLASYDLTILYQFYILSLGLTLNQSYIQGDPRFSQKIKKLTLFYERKMVLLNLTIKQDLFYFKAFLAGNKNKSMAPSITAISFITRSRFSSKSQKTRQKLIRFLQKKVIILD